MEATSRLGLPYIMPSQAQKHVTHNEALQLVDLLAGVIAILDRDLSNPPSASDGDVHILGGTGSGGWSGFSAGDLALRIDGAWRRVQPSAGMVASIVDEDGLLVYHDGTAWAPLTLGEPGLDAYQVAVENGFVGSAEDWLLSLVGADGNDGAAGPPGEGLAIDAQGTFAGRGAFDDEEPPFVYYSEDGDGDEVTDGVLFRKLSAASADWGNPIVFPAAPGGGSVDALFEEELAKSAAEQSVARGNIGAIGNLRSFQVFSSSGTWTRPAGCKAILVQLVGGGGGGRGPSGTSGAAGIAAGGGGGAGFSQMFIDVSAISTVTVTIGAGGPGGAAGGNNGSDGGTTSFGAHCAASGGKGGANSGGEPGSGSGGDLNSAGLPGGHRTVAENGTAYSGSGGNSFFSGGGLGATAAMAGGDGGPGAGGGGGRSNNDGGDGGDGLVLVWEFY